jgi:hypothetical protein
MRPIGRYRRAWVGVLLVAGLAGCWARGGSTAATATTGSQDAAALVREWVRCMRANGMPNLPDPRIDPDGRPRFPEGTPEPPDRALRACQPIVNRLPPAMRVEETPPPPDMPALVRFARCVREHGLTDFPDPKADGIFRLAGTNARREIYGAGATKQPPSSRASAALEACGFNGALRGRVFLDVG